LPSLYSHVLYHTENATTNSSSIAMCLYIA
jgi:hypothetical protein